MKTLFVDRQIYRATVDELQYIVIVEVLINPVCAAGDELPEKELDIPLHIVGRIVPKMASESIEAATIAG
jgi:hypothetical protein